MGSSTICCVYYGLSLLTIVDTYYFKRFLNQCEHWLLCFWMILSTGENKHFIDYTTFWWCYFRAQCKIVDWFIPRTHHIQLDTRHTCVHFPMRLHDAAMYVPNCAVRARVPRICILVRSFSGNHVIKIRNVLVRGRFSPSCANTSDVTLCKTTCLHHFKQVTNEHHIADVQPSAATLLL